MVSSQQWRGGGKDACEQAGVVAEVRVDELVLDVVGSPT
jgi:hypothetical protein